MRLPDNFLEFEGRKIAVRRIVETGGDHEDTALYITKAGELYVYFRNAERSLVECVREYCNREGVSSVNLPGNMSDLDALAGHSIRIVKVSEHGALAWYVREFLNDDCPLTKLMREAIAAFVPKAERDGKVQLVAWVGKALAAQLARSAKAGRISEHQQLVLLVEDGLRRDEGRRRAAKRKKAISGSTRGDAVQLELATALVEVVKEFAAAPDLKTLGEARRKVCALHQNLHADETFKLAAAI